VRYLKIGSKPQAKYLPKEKKITKEPAFVMNKLVEGRKKEEAYTTFFDHFVPCTTKKTSRDRRIAKAVFNSGSNKDQTLCTISDEGFALLLSESTYDQWLDFHSNNKGRVMLRCGVKQRGFQSGVPTVVIS
jgi:hypothetical protein